MIIGDFNSYMYSRDKNGDQSKPSVAWKIYVNLWMKKGSLIWDLRVFTWNNKRAGRENIQIRLDRGIVNASWKFLFPTVSISHLMAVAFDHRPLLLDTLLSSSSHPKLFRSEDMQGVRFLSSDTIHFAWGEGDKPYLFAGLCSSL